MNTRKLRLLDERLRSWKPIHLCWLFRRLGIPIPPYLIAGGTNFELTGSRIANGTRSWQADEDVDVSDWDTADPFIVAAMVECTTKGGESGNIQLRWRNKTDSGSFAVLSDTGELTYDGDTDLVNGNAVTSGEAGCTPGGASTWDDGVEREGANDVSTALAYNEYTEHHWAVDASNAHDGDEYEFEVYDATAATSIGTLAATVTTAAGAIQQQCGVTITVTPANVKRKIFKTLGVGITVAASNVKRKIFKTLGVGITVTPTCAQVIKFFQSCGVTITVTPAVSKRKIFKTLGANIIVTPTVSKFKIFKTLGVGITVSPTVAKVKISKTFNVTVNVVASCAANLLGGVTGVIQATLKRLQGYVS